MARAALFTQVPGIFGRSVTFIGADLAFYLQQSFVSPAPPAAHRTSEELPS
jgi:hypothetical protein